MPRRNGSLAAHALVVCAGGAATVGAIALVAAWWAADRLAESAGVPVAGGPEASDGALALLRWTIAGGVALVAGAAATLAWAVVRRDVLAPLRQMQDVTERVSRGDNAARAAVRGGTEVAAFADSLNRMIDANERTQRQLASVNEALDLKVGELSEANVGLGESNRLKSEFLANVSHELRTPLNSIIGFADLLEEIAKADPAADPKRLRYINNIQRSGRSLLDMINELLDMAKIEAGRMEVTIAPASVSDLAEGLQAIMRPVAQQRRIELEQRVPAELPRVETDAGKLQQILYNFMSNAIKFSPEDGVVIVGAEQVTRDGHAAVRISVTDHGPGIPADMQDTVFEKFRQVDATHTRRAGGTGLGLAICRELADLLECGVGLVSAPGRGSTFWVEVPLVHRPRQLKPLMG
jgi:signal transduction histidine kinase